MKDGLIKVAAGGFEVKIADPMANAEEIIKKVKDASDAGAKIIVFAELCVTGYTCGDLFFHRTLLEGACDAIERIAEETAETDILVAVGAPFAVKDEVYNCAFFLLRGELLGIVPKKNLPNYGEFYEARSFASGCDEVCGVMFGGETVPFGSKLLFSCESIPELCIGAEICEDMWQVNPPAQEHIRAGATVIVNLSASNELAGKQANRETIVKSISARGMCAYLYADAGYGESSTDAVYAGSRIIAENGKIKAKSKPFEQGVIYDVIDVYKLAGERRKKNTFTLEDEGYVEVHFPLEAEETSLEYVKKSPFIPSERAKLEERCEEILSLQAYGLKKRLEHTKAKTAVIGISGGLDSTLALLVTHRAFGLMGKPFDEIIAITMPCFGTTDRTYNNAVSLVKALGATLMEIPIAESVKSHFKDIGQAQDNHDVTYENAQARERTQVLMDVANMKGGLVIGTGDMSELALGWATYNGDHMSMYGVNSSVPKTLVRFLVKYLADSAKDENMRAVLSDILDTPVSPELLPPENGGISQKTEDLVGPYELHDFYLFYFLRYQFAPSKILRLAKIAFEGEYDEATIKKWLAVFIKRFFGQQFKRSCLPDGPKVGSVALSPRGDLRMPSDAVCRLWLEKLEKE